MGPDGWIYMVPYAAKGMGVLNPWIHSFSTIDVSEKVSGNQKYSGGVKSVLAPNGDIYFCPAVADTV